jgi:hypothetical protein
MLEKKMVRKVYQAMKEEENWKEITERRKLEGENWKEKTERRKLKGEN